MKIVWATLIAVFLAGSLLSGAGAQSAAPVAGGNKQMEGQVKSLDPTGKKLTLADGTEFTVPETVRVARTELRPGAKVKVAYAEQGGQKILKHIEVAQ